MTKISNLNVNIFLVVFLVSHGGPRFIASGGEFLLSDAASGTLPPFKATAKTLHESKILAYLQIFYDPTLRFLITFLPISLHNSFLGPKLQTSAILHSLSEVKSLSPLSRNSYFLRKFLAFTTTFGTWRNLGHQVVKKWGPHVWVIFVWEWLSHEYIRCFWHPSTFSGQSHDLVFSL